MATAYERHLHENWKLMVLDDAVLNDAISTVTDFSRYDSPVLEASVPGDWVLDYVREGLLPEPFYADNYMKIRDYENSHIYYATSFVWNREISNRVFLKFDGIDTVADIYLNGTLIGHAENMYIPHEFAASTLRKGENELLVHIKPVALEARKYPIAAHSRAQKYNYESVVIRKAPHMFGWDICPRIVSAGLWRPVSIVEKKAERIENVFLWVNRLAGGAAQCTAVFDVEIGREHVAPYEIRIEGRCGENTFSAAQKLWYIHGHLNFDVPQVKLWWPAGYGDQNLYRMTATLYRSGAPIDSIEWTQGLRTTELVYDDYITGDDPAEFCFIINGKRIYIKGTNWVPADAFHSNDVNRIPPILEMLPDIHCNAMRVWGGGVYESDYFYDWCDEHGIIIWQDFMMACALYPQTPRMKQQLEEEAAAIVRRLRHHACICLWAGDNECDQFYDAYGPNGVDPNHNELTRDILPRVLRTEDVSRPFLASSPYISPESYKKGLATQTPEQHLWGPRDYFKSPFYHDHNATFASEMGYHGCNSPESLRKFIPEDHLWPCKDDPMWFYHCASPEVKDALWTWRIELMSKQIHYFFNREPDNLESFAYMSQISQAEAKKYFVESFRSRKGARTGLIWWNLMDNWPQISDAIVDYYFCKKLAYHFIKRSQDTVSLMMDDHGGQLNLYGVSDLFEDVSVHYTVTDLATDTVIAEAHGTLAADTSTPLFRIDQDGAHHFYLIRWETENDLKGSNHYLDGTIPFDYNWYMDCLKKAGYDQFEGFSK